MIYLRLFYEFFKTGLFAIGGGLATLPFLSDMADRTGWFTQAQLADMLAVSESTPGPVGVNMATYVGFETAGVLGAIVATLGLVFPSIVIILVIAGFLKAFRNNKFVDAAFYGLRPASTAMVASAGIGVVLLSLVDTSASGLAFFRWKELALAAVILVLTRWVPFTKKLHPIVFIARGVPLLNPCEKRTLCFGLGALFLCVKCQNAHFYNRNVMVFVSCNLFPGGL